MRIKRTISNNAVLAIDSEGRDVVALGRGLGHARKAGEELDDGTVEQVFVASDADTTDQFARLLANVPLDVVRAASQVARLAHERIGVPFSPALVIPLADHLAFALDRAAKHLPIELPLAWEVTQLYPREVAVGREAVSLIRTTLGTELEAAEAQAIAMHLVNSAFATQGVSGAMTMTRTIMHMFEVIETAMGITIDPDAMSTARFVTHLRYLFVRVRNGEQLSDPQTALTDAIGNAHPDAAACARKLALIIAIDTGIELTRDEVAYLALHVARLIMTAPQTPDSPSRNERSTC